MVRRRKNVLSDDKFRKVLIVLLVAAIGISLYSELFVFLILLLGATVLEFIVNQGQIKFNVGHIYFLAFILARMHDLGNAILLIVISGFLVHLYIGDIDIKAMVLYPMEIITIAVTTLFAGSNIVLVGIVSSFICHTLSMAIAKSLGEPLPELMTEVGLAFIMNIAYFVSLAGPVTMLISKVIAI